MPCSLASSNRYEPLACVSSLMKLNSKTRPIFLGYCHQCVRGLSTPGDETSMLLMASMNGCVSAVSSKARLIFSHCSSEMPSGVSTYSSNNMRSLVPLNTASINVALYAEQVDSNKERISLGKSNGMAKC